MKNLKTLHILMVVNTRSFSDGTSVAVDLAKIISKPSKKIALIDANLRSPAVHKLLGIPNKRGFYNVLQNGHMVSDVTTIISNPTISVIPSGNLLPDMISTISSRKIKDTLESLRTKFDQVIINGPSIMFEETLLFTKHVDGIVMLVQPGFNNPEKMKKLMDLVKNEGITVITIMMRDQPQYQAQQSAFLDQLLLFDKQSHYLADENES